jgi:hypothetical protein
VERVRPVDERVHEGVRDVVEDGADDPVEERACELVGERELDPAARRGQRPKTPFAREVPNGPRTSAISIRSPGCIRLAVVNACRTPRNSTWIVATARPVLRSTTSVRLHQGRKSG